MRSVKLGAMRPQPLICVTDVEASSRWYQRLLGCRGTHGGGQYEQLVKDGLLSLQLKPPGVYKGKFDLRVLLKAFRALHDIAA